MLVCYNKGMQYLDELVQKITTKADLKGFDELDKKQKRARRQNDLLARSFRNAFGMFLGIQGIRSVIEVSRKFDLMQKSIQGLTKSADDFKYLRKEAYRTGTDLLTIAGSYKNFYSAATGVGFGKGAIQGMFSDVLVAGRGIGANQQQIGAALLALEQMLSKGKVSAQELRLQMGNALPGAFEIAARSMGVTTAKLDEMMRKGELASSVFVPKFTAQLKKELGGGFELATKSLDFALVNLATAWQEFQAEILQGETGQALAQFVKQLTAILRSQTLLNSVRLLGRALAVIIKNLKWILIFWGVAKIVQITQSVMRLHYAILATAKSTAALGAVTRTLALSYQMLAGGQVLKGLAMLRAGLWSLVAPTLILSAKIALIIAGILMLQDLLLTFADPTADTYTRDLINGYKNLQKKSKEQEGIYESVYGNQNPLRGKSVGEKQREQEKIRQNILKKDTVLKSAYLPSDVSPLNPSSYTGTYSSSNQNQLNNTIAINIYSQQGQNAQDIGEAVALKLGNILDNYVMVT